MIDSSQAGLLGTGSFAEVRRGTYAFSTHSAPTEVAFKIFRGSQSLDQSLRQQILQHPSERAVQAGDCKERCKQDRHGYHAANKKNHSLSYYGGTCGTADNHSTRPAPPKGKSQGPP